MSQQNPPLEKKAPPENLYPCDWCGTLTPNLREGYGDPQTGYVSSEVWCGCNTRKEFAREYR